MFGLAEIEMDYRRERQAGTTKAKPARAKALHAQGLTAAEIANALAVSPRTVFRYLAQSR